MVLKLVKYSLIRLLKLSGKSQAQTTAGLSGWLWRFKSLEGLWIEDLAEMADGSGYIRETRAYRDTHVVVRRVIKRYHGQQ